MLTERIQRRIDALLDDAEAAAAEERWERVHELALDVLTLDAQNEDAPPFAAMAERRLGAAATPPATSPEPAPSEPAPSEPASP